MKTGKTLVELATEIERRKDAKKDFIAPVGRIEMVTGDGGAAPIPMLMLDGNILQSFEVNKPAHNQIAQYLGIPSQYYQRMAEADPKLLATNVNRWLHDSDLKKDKRMVRTLDGRVRALLSDRYRMIENDLIAEAVLPLLMDRDMQIVSAEITETRLYIKAVDNKIQKDIPTGARMGDGSHHIFDTLSPAIVFGNSETGHGSYFVEAGIWTRACTNMAIFGAKMRKYHVGARAELSDDVYALLTDNTRKLSDAALMGQLRDIVAGSLDALQFDSNVKQLQESAEAKIDGDASVVQVIDNVGKRFGLAEGEKNGILQRLIEGGDLTRYGLHGAITRHSADLPDYDRATELERLGGAVAQLGKQEWHQLLKAA